MSTIILIPLHNLPKTSIKGKEVRITNKNRKEYGMVGMCMGDTRHVADYPNPICVQIGHKRKDYRAEEVWIVE